MSQRADILMGFLHSREKWAAGCLVREKQSKQTQKHRPEEHGLTPWECTHTELLPRQMSKVRGRHLDVLRRGSHRRRQEDSPGPWLTGPGAFEFLLV